jgi:hypothetical protein
MHSDIHLMLASSSSMIITFGLHWIMSQVTARCSILQTIFFDYLRDFILVVRCLIYDRRGMHFWNVEFRY